VRSTIFGITIGLSLLTACGDDSDGVPDARLPDAADPDAALPVFKKFEADEGGEVRVEYMRFINNNRGIRATGFLYNNPGTVKYFPFINMMGTCQDVTDKTLWPVASNPIAERDYADPGTIIVAPSASPTMPLPMGAGNARAFAFPRNTAMGSDPFGKPHPAIEWFFDPSSGADTVGGDYLSADTYYDVMFGGSAEVPSAVHDNALYMPADYNLTGTYANEQPVSISAGTPITFTWDTPPSNPPGDLKVMSLVGFLSPMSGPMAVCIEPDDGSVTMPANLIDKVRSTIQAQGVTCGAAGPCILSRQKFVHQVRELVDANGPTGKRIDFVAVWCFAYPYTLN